MIQRTALKVYRKKTLFCIILAVFFCAFTITLHMPETKINSQQSTSNVGTGQGTATDDGNMASAMSNDDLMFGSVMVNEMRTGSSQHLLQAVCWNKSAAPVMRFVLSWLVLFSMISLLITYWYWIQADKYLICKFCLYIVLKYIHNCDGKKSV